MGGGPLVVCQCQVRFDSFWFSNRICSLGNFLSSSTVCGRSWFFFITSILPSWVAILARLLEQLSHFVNRPLGQRQIVLSVATDALCFDAVLHLSGASLP